MPGSNARALEKARTLPADALVLDLEDAVAPGMKVEARARVLAALQAVDFVVVFEEATPLELIQAIKPEVLVKGADYSRDKIVGADVVESYGGRVHLAVFQQGFSTTSLMERLRAA
jgi:D-beta-D-heptose 7-phosphate kinase/D-beta-D-heptose 1-phosphate adenosyltransferase